MCIIISTTILVIERELRRHKASQKAVAAKTQSCGINKKRNHGFHSEDREEAELTPSDHTSDDDEPVDVIASQFAAEVNLFLLVGLGLLLTQTLISNVFNHIGPIVDHWHNFLITTGSQLYHSKAA